MASSIANIDHALKRAGTDYAIIVFPRASHTFDAVPEPDQPFEWPRMAPGFPDLVTAWVKERVK